MVKPGLDAGIVLNRADRLADRAQVMSGRRRVWVSLVGLGLALAVTGGAAVPNAADGSPAPAPTPRQLAALDATDLAAAASALAQQAVTSGALRTAPALWPPATSVLTSVEALTRLALRTDPSLKPSDTTAIMGPVPRHISHHLQRRPHHVHLTRTYALSRFARAVDDGGSSGIGHRRKHDGSMPAPYQAPDGVFVDPVLPTAKPLTVGIVALRAALKELGQPYVWGGAGPSTFDCSGLVQWAYAHAGLQLAHHAATQWNEGRLIPGRDILPGDLIMFGHPIFHVGIYLGAGWMLNAPYTGQWVDVVPVPSRVTGVIRP
jgi:cell wall-associated NlpC family hydrolase